MYLEFLTEPQRELCVELAINLASTDGNFSQKERLLIEGYCHDAGMNVNFNNKEILPLQMIIEHLLIITGMVERKIIVFEMARLAIVDNVFHENEKDMLNDLAAQFELDDTYVQECIDAIEAYAAIEEKINHLVLN